MMIHLDVERAWYTKVAGTLLIATLVKPVAGMVLLNQYQNFSQGQGLKAPCPRKSLKIQDKMHDTQF